MSDKEGLSTSEANPPSNVAESSPEVSKRKLKKQAKAANKGGKTVTSSGIMSVDAAVQHTNDDSVVSKRSAVYHKYFDDPYLRCFVKKLSRRSPLINRGYYLRMLAITDIVQQCIHHVRGGTLGSLTSSPDTPPVQVVSLGAGFDTLAFRLYNAPEFHNVQYFDVDYPAVISNKIALMHAGPLSSFPFSSSADDGAQKAVFEVRDSDHPEFHCDRYHAVGLDLRFAPTALISTLQRGFPHFSPSAPTVFYAECVMQYMSADVSSDLVRFIASNFPCARFAAYDQLHPRDSFGKVMQGSLKSKNSPLLGVDELPDGNALCERAKKCGMAEASFADFYSLSAHYIDGAERSRVEDLESFDEHEEWREMCEHYGITVASTERCSSDRWPINSCFRRGGDGGLGGQSGTVEGSAMSVPLRATQWPTGRFGFEGWGNGGVYIEDVQGDESKNNRTSSGPGRTQLNSQTSRFTVSFGGFVVGKSHERVSTVFVHSLANGELPVTLSSTSPSQPPSPRVFHSFTRLAPCQYLIFGGRSNPTAPLDDCYLMRVALPSPRVLPTFGSQNSAVISWTRLQLATNSDSPPPRYRHVMTTLLPDKQQQDGSGSRYSVWLFGGRTCDGSTLGDSWIGHINTHEGTIAWEVFAMKPSAVQREVSHIADGMERRQVVETEIPPLSSSAVVTLPDGRVLLSGGRGENDVSSSGMWLVDVARREFTSITHTKVQGSITARFSHSMCCVRYALDGTDHDAVLILGGCGDVPKDSFIEAYLLVLRDSEPCALLPLPHIEDRDSCPTWLRSSCTALADGVVGIFGGGFTCFSFGTTANKPSLLHIGEVDAAKIPAQCGFTTGKENESSLNENSKDGDAGGLTSAQMARHPHASWISGTVLPRASVLEGIPYDDDVFLRTAANPVKPVLFTNAPLGSCTVDWSSPEYLKSKEGSCPVSVHVASASTQKLDFVKKNFKFKHVSFGELVDHCAAATAKCRSSASEVPPTDGESEPSTTSDNARDSETWYFRSVGTNMKNEKSNVWRDFAAIGNDFALPPVAWEHIQPRLHQSCLRINAPPLQLWTHYDTLDNVLCQIVGQKRVLLFPPSEYNNLYVVGSSSSALEMDHPDIRRFPRLAQALQNAIEVILNPGDMLFLPSLWFHHITSTGESSNAGTSPYTISVNVFFERFAKDDYDGKDLYGNKDLPAGVKLREDIVSYVQRRIFDAPRTSAPHGASFASERSAVSGQSHAATATATATTHSGNNNHNCGNGCGGVLQISSGDVVPTDFVEFALREAIQDLERIADDLAASRRV